jgi:acyl-coenzyme A thioesterase 13
MVVEKMDKGTVWCTMPVTKDVSNTYGTLHGGAIATLCDIVTTIAIITIDPRKAGVSVDLNVSYIGKAKVGSKVEVKERRLSRFGDT